MVWKVRNILLLILIHVKTVGWTILPLLLHQTNLISGCFSSCIWWIYTLAINNATNLKVKFLSNFLWIEKNFYGVFSLMPFEVKVFFNICYFSWTHNILSCIFCVTLMWNLILKGPFCAKKFSKSHIRCCCCCFNKRTAFLESWKI